MEPLSSVTGPSISALFLVLFDKKVGYTIAWKRNLPEVDVDGVEYQSLPSGLHSVRQDLVYFAHGKHVGVSAFVQEESHAGDRNARFATVGALVERNGSRLGRTWEHAEALRQLARGAARDSRDTRALELFWKKYRQDEADKSNLQSPAAARRMSVPFGQERRKRARSDSSAALAPDDNLALDHPALMMADMLRVFGPLIFRLFRALLLRKRVLLLAAPPVQRSCNIIYALSVLSSIPASLADALPADTDALARLLPSFSVGIHDIPFLAEQQGTEGGWLACTTDDILGEKPELWDVLIELPQEVAGLKGTKRRPKIRISSGAPVKATQRDLRRYRILCAELARLKQLSEQRYHDEPTPATSMEDDRIPLTRTTTSALLNEIRYPKSEEQEGDNVEPVTWTAMAYHGFMWWASAGEMEAWENEEVRADREFLDDLPEVEHLLPRPHSSRRDHTEDERDSELSLAQATATILTAYFHRLTACHLRPLASLVEEADDETEEGIDENSIPVSLDDIRALGLDAWSAADKEFVKDAMALWYGRTAVISEGGTRICGVRVC